MAFGRVPYPPLVVGVDVRASVDQPIDDMKMSFLHGVVQRRHPEVVKAVHPVFSLKQVINTREIPVLRSSVQLLALKLCG